jgi:hypothetical protein
MNILAARVEGDIEGMETEAQLRGGPGEGRQGPSKA